MNPISVAVRGKGGLGCVRRARKIARDYGSSGAKMAASLTEFTRLLQEFGCSGTFPITSVVLGRNPGLIRSHQDQGIEFAVHGYRHTDFSRMSFETQLDQLSLARRLFERCGIQPHGFRSPYLRQTVETQSALVRCGFLYDASQAVAWDNLPCQAPPEYSRALSFYGSVPAGDSPSLPQLEDGIVRIPYCLPDDESVIDRLALTNDQITGTWLGILKQTMATGELFCLGIHPERIAGCSEALRCVLSAAKQSGTVWIARLDEIARWWKSRTQADIHISPQESGKLRIRVNGPAGTTILLRGVASDNGTAPAFGTYLRSTCPDLTVSSPVRPFIGFNRGTSGNVIGFLREQGYILETGAHPDSYAHYIGLTRLGREKRQLLDRLESSERPLVRLARWPHGYQSALAVTGDIDALTCWDYGLRFLGR